MIARLVEQLPAGRENAVRAPVLARRMGLSVRNLQELIVEAIDQGVLIGSSCGRRPGFFIIENLDDLERGTAHIRARALGSLRRWSAVRRAALERFAEPDVQRLFQLEELEPAKDEAPAGESQGLHDSSATRGPVAVMLSPTPPKVQRPDYRT